LLAVCRFQFFKVKVLAVFYFSAIWLLSLFQQFVSGALFRFFSHSNICSTFFFSVSFKPVLVFLAYMVGTYLTLG